MKANQDIITFNTNMFIDCQFGEYTIEQFIYKVLRCGLLHEGEVPEMFEFAQPDESVVIGDSKWRIPKTFIFGTLLAVIGASTNNKHSLPDAMSVTIMGKLSKLMNYGGVQTLFAKQWSHLLRNRVKVSIRRAPGNMRSPVVRADISPEERFCWIVWWEFDGSISMLPNSLIWWAV